MFILEGSFYLSKPELRALLAHASEDETRPHVCGVGFFPQKGAACATDGHRLALLECDEKSDVAAFIVSRATLEAAMKACPAKGAIGVSRERLTVHEAAALGPALSTIAPTMTLAVPPVLASFPPYEHIIPGDYRGNADREPAPCFGVNARYLADVALCAAACEKIKGTSKTLHEPHLVFYPPTGYLDPMIATVGPWLVLLMPAREREPQALHEARLAKRAEQKRARKRAIA
jgi:hypothetical protein